MTSKFIILTTATRIDTVYKIKFGFFQICVFHWKEVFGCLFDDMFAAVLIIRFRFVLSTFTWTFLALLYAIFRYLKLQVEPRWWHKLYTPREVKHSTHFA